MALSQISEQRFHNFPWLSIRLFNHRLTYSLVTLFANINTIQTISAIVSLDEMEASYIPLYGFYQVKIAKIFT